MDHCQGTVYWITGLAGAGKSTIARLLYVKIRRKRANVVLLDGDELRKSIASDLGYTEADRRRGADRYSRLCAILARQGIDVIIPTIALYHTVHAWNRNNIENYCEIFVDAPMDVLMQRNQKSLYTGIKKGLAQNIAGIDVSVEFPLKPDILLKSDGSMTPEECVDIIVKWIAMHHNAGS